MLRSTYLELEHHAQTGNIGIVIGGAHQHSVGIVSNTDTHAPAGIELNTRTIGATRSTVGR